MLMRNIYATHTDYGDFFGLIPDNPHFVPSNVDGMTKEIIGIIKPARNNDRNNRWNNHSKN